MNVSTTLLLIRHGETDLNIAGKAQWTKDIPLNETGIRQAQDLALLLRKSHPDIAHIYSSDLLRALKTAEPLSYLSQLPIPQHTLLR